MKYLSILKGFRTFVLGAIVAVAPAFMTYVAGVDWSHYGLSPAAGVLIGGLIVSLRAITTTPPGKAI